MTQNTQELPNPDAHQDELGVNWTEVAEREQAGKQWDQAQDDVEREFRLRMERQARIRGIAPFIGPIAARVYARAASIGDHPSINLSDASEPLKRRDEAERILHRNSR